MQRVLTPLASALLRLGVSPDAVTIAGTLVVVVTALWAFPTGHLFLGALLIGLFALTDSLDGVMARQSGRSGPWGAFLDSTLDRFGDGAIFAGLVLGSVVPYARARAEGLGMTASGGIAERADRLLVALVATAAVGLGAPPVVLTVVLGLLAVASAVTVVQRMAKVHRQAVGVTE